MFSRSRSGLRVSILLSLFALIAIWQVLPTAFGSQNDKQATNSLKLIVELGNNTNLSAVAFSPDGKLLATSDTEVVCLWNALTGQQIYKFKIRALLIPTVVFSPDSKYLVAGCYDNLIRVWDMKTAQEVRQLSGHTRGITSAAFSPDGKFLATGSLDKTIRIWDFNTGKEVRRLQGHQYSVRSVAFSRDGRYLASGDGEGELNSECVAKVWDVTTGQEMKEFRGHQEQIHSVSISPDGKTLATGASDGTARLWSIATGDEIHRLTGKDYRTFESVCFSPDGTCLATAHYINGNTAIAAVWDTATGKEIKRFQDADNDSCSVAFSPDGRHLAVAYSQNTCGLWDVKTGQKVQSYEGRSSSVQAVSFSSDGRYLSAGSSDGTAHLWDLAAGRLSQRFIGHESGSRVAAVAFSHDNRFLATGASDATARLWDIETGKQIRSFTGSRFSTISVAFSPDARYLAAGESGKTAHLWDVSTGQQIRKFEGHEGDVNSVRFSPDGKYLATGSWDKTARLWRVATGEEVRRYDNQEFGINEVTFSPNGKYLAAGSLAISLFDQRVRIWEVETGKEIQHFDLHGGSVYSVAFSPDGRYLATSEHSGIARIWEISSGKQVRVFTGHEEYIPSLTFSPNGKYLATASGDNTTRLWDVTTGHEVARLIVFRNGGWIVVAPNGRFDTDNLDQVDGVHWSVPETPLQPLPPEIFLRQYYEPNLLKRLLSEERFPPLPSIARLNRVQPVITITDVSRAPDGTARVTVKAVEQATNKRSSGLRDLRLLRDGQLVGWRDGKIASGTFMFTHIALPQAHEEKRVEFSVYGFNSDLVKSKTANKILQIPSSPITRSRRAYVIAMGVDASEDTNLKLRFAVNDAHAVAHTVSERLASTKEYPSVITVLLTASDTPDSRQIAAKKEDLHLVLAKLSGVRLTPQETKRLSRIPGASKLLKATPDDLVLLSFSGHGYAGDKGEFYLLPYDVGADPLHRGMTPQRLAHCISSEELSLWLRGIDAGEMVCIIDACHSAAAVEADGSFKPGPMGNRGLGQIAYDKRIRLLAATQAPNVALESSKLGKGQGLLTYALVENGLEEGKADFQPKDGIITLTEWLKYGVSRVPKLWDEVGRGRTAARPIKLRSVAGAQLQNETVQDTARQRRDLQYPVLFDFSSNRPGAKASSVLSKSNKP